MTCENRFFGKYLGVKTWLTALLLAVVCPCLASDTRLDAAHQPAPVPKVPDGAEVITLGAGCFWCTEAIFQQLPGVLFVTSGFMGGTKTNLDYEQLCTGNTAHAED